MKIDITPLVPFRDLLYEFQQKCLLVAGLSLFLFIALPQQAEASSCTISGTVNSSTNPLGSGACAGVDTVYLTGTLNINTNYNSFFGGVLIVNGGIINWVANFDFVLENTAKLILINGGNLAPVGGAGCTGT